MTGPEHFRTAEKFRERAAEAQSYAYDGGKDGWEKAAYWNTAAQVHATLAAVAATIETAAARGPGDITQQWQDVIWS